MRTMLHLRKDTRAGETLPVMKRLKRHSIPIGLAHQGGTAREDFFDGVRFRAADEQARFAGFDRP